MPSAWHRADNAEVDSAPEHDRSFVLHDHRRPTPHFDLRLEDGGVLRSWALPKGVPTSPDTNRLAVEVDDHELAHLTYTDEHKSIADIGWWEEHDRNDRRLLFTLHGRTGSTRYALIRTSENWLLHRTKTQPASGVNDPEGVTPPVPG
jgi:DNA ligase D-like protein (predicted 3'-phosphoesterase)